MGRPPLEVPEKKATIVLAVNIGEVSMAYTVRTGGRYQRCRPIGGVMTSAKLTVDSRLGPSQTLRQSGSLRLSGV
jgi:hypothetical protein